LPNFYIIPLIHCSQSVYVKLLKSIDRAMVTCNMHASFMQQFPSMLRVTSWHLLSVVLVKTFNNFSMPAIHQHKKPQNEFCYTNVICWKNKQILTLHTQ